MRVTTLLFAQAQLANYLALPQQEQVAERVLAGAQ
jgi:hypothetical protein